MSNRVQKSATTASTRRRGGELFKADAARQALLDAGAQILSERGVSAGLERVTLKEAMERAGVPRTTAYRVFAGDAGAVTTFRHELLAQLDADMNSTKSFERVGEMLADASDVLDSGDPAALADLMREMIRVGFGERVEELRAQVEWRAFVSSVAAQDHTTPEVVRAAAAKSGEWFVPLFEMVGSIFGIRPTPPLTWDGFTDVLVGALDGAVLRTIASPSYAEIERHIDGTDPHARWNGLAVIAEGVFLVWCEPDPDAAVSADLSRWTGFA